TSVFLCQGGPARALLRLLDESGAFRNGRRHERGLWPRGLSHHTDRRDVDCRLRRDVVVLRATPVRRSLLGTSWLLGLHGGGLARQFFLQTSQGPAMVLGEHRVSSHPSPEPADSKLSPRKMPQGRTAVSKRPARHVVFQPQITHLPALG